jgi:hypothetical protein
MLAELNGLSQEQVITHLLDNYIDSDADASFVKEQTDKLSTMDILLAYEDRDGYESSSFFILQNRISKELFIIRGAHCSCFGYENQLELEETNIEALKKIAEKSWVVEEEYRDKFKSFVNSLEAKL